MTAEWGYGKTEAPSGAESLPRKRGGTGDYKGAALMSFNTKRRQHIMKKIITIPVVILLVAAIPAATALSHQPLSKPPVLLTSPPHYTNDTPPSWATGNFSGVWGVTILGVPVAPLGWITGYYQTIGFGRLEAVYANFNETNATSFLKGIMIWIFFLGGAGDLQTGNATWVSGIGVANDTHFYWRINAIIGPSFYIFCTYTPFENTTRADVSGHLLREKYN